jgi:lysozyme
VDLSKLIEDLIRDEGLRLKPYTDSVGKTTIGVGRNLTDMGISRDEAYRMLNNDLEKTQADLDQHLPWWKKLDEVRQRVIANMAFNMGLPRLLAFKRTLDLIQAGDYETAATEMLCSVWAKQVGPRAVRLSDLMRRGI